MHVVTVQSIPPALRLAPTQLAEVLRRVPQAERLQHCAPVCKAFQHAAVLATGQFTVTGWHGSYAAACKWLQAHGLAAAVSSISVKPRGLSAAESVQPLPWDQLPVLQQLTLLQCKIPELPVPVLSSLTHLHFENCMGPINSFTAHTQLQHLALVHCTLGWCTAHLAHPTMTKLQRSCRCCGRFCQPCST